MFLSVLPLFPNLSPSTLFTPPPAMKPPTHSTNSPKLPKSVFKYPFVHTSHTRQKHTHKPTSAPTAHVSSNTKLFELSPVFDLIRLFRYSVIFIIIILFFFVNIIKGIIITGSEFL